MAERQRNRKGRKPQGRIAALRQRVRGVVSDVRGRLPGGRKGKQPPMGLRQRIVERLEKIGLLREGRLDEGRTARSQEIAPPPARTSPPRPRAPTNRAAASTNSPFPGGQHGSNTRGMGKGADRRDSSRRGRNN